MTVEDNKSIVTRALEVALVGRDPEAARDMFAEGFVGHGPAEDARGQDGAVAEFQTYLDAFGEISLDIQNVVGEGDRVVVHFVGQGRQTGVFQGVPPSGRLVNVSGVVINIVRDGRIAEGWWTLSFS